MDSTFRALDALRLLRAPIPWASDCAKWILSCRKENGGYAGEPGWHANVAWTYMALRSLAALKVSAPDGKATQAWLGTCFNEDGGCGSGPVVGSPRYHPAWQSTTEYTSYAIQALVLLDAAPPDPGKTRQFLLTRQVNRSGFNRRGGQPATYYTALALDGLRRLPKEADEIDYRKGALAWLLALRRGNGSYGWDGASYGTLRNTYHVLAGLRSLQISLSAKELSRTRDYVRDCRAETGGFGHRPGMTPTVVDTWYGIRSTILLSPDRARDGD
jgi:prenyltransferase beta subunit